MRYYIFILLILFFAWLDILLPLTGRPGEGAQPVLKGYGNYRFTYSVLLDKPAVPGTLVLPVPRSIYPFQKVENLTFRPEPHTIIADEHRNMCALFPITAGENKTVRVSLDITLYHATFPLDTGDSPGLRKTLPLGSAPYLQPEADARDAIKELEGIISPLEKEPLYRVVALYDYVRTAYTFKERPFPRALSEVIRDRELQCCDGAVLFVNLCRQAGIPARLLSGVYVAKDGMVLPQTHAWALVYLTQAGWVPFDPTLGRFDDRSRSLCLGEQRPYYIKLWEGYHDLALFWPSVQGSGKPKLSLAMEMRQTGEDRILHTIGGSHADPPDLPPARLREGCSREAFALYMEGKGEENSGEWLAAKEKFHRAAELVPTFLRAHKELIKCGYMSGTLEETCRHYRESMEREPGNAYLLYYSSLCDLYNGHYGSAEMKLKDCEGRGLLSSELYNSLGYLYLVTKQYKKAEEAFAAALNAEGDHFTTYGNLISMYQNAEEWKAMTSWAARGLEEFPDNRVFVAQMGYGFLKMGHPGAALPLIQKAVDGDPSMGWYVALKGWALKELGRKTDARGELLRGLSLKKGIGNEKFYRDMLLELEND
jgi:tetratricopeptide (TPR) repeat protein